MGFFVKTGRKSQLSDYQCKAVLSEMEHLRRDQEGAKVKGLIRDRIHSQLEGAVSGQTPQAPIFDSLPNE